MRKVRSGYRASLTSFCPKSWCMPQACGACSPHPRRPPCRRSERSAAWSTASGAQGFYLESAPCARRAAGRAWQGVGAGHQRTAAEPGSAGHAGAPAPAANAGADLIVNLWRLDRSQARAPVLPSQYCGTCMRRSLGTFAAVSRVMAYWCGLVTILLLSCQACTAVRYCERVSPAGGHLCGEAHEAQRLTGDALCTQARTWSVADLRTHLANATGSAAAFDGLWAAMQRSLGALGLRAPARTAR